MKTKIISALIAVIISMNIYAQEGKWKKGDKIEVKNMSQEWVKATIIEVVDWTSSGKGIAYRIITDDPKAANNMWTATENTIRDIAPKNDAVKKETADKKQVDQGGGNFKVGDKVDTYYDKNHGHNRGTIIAAGDRKYKVHYTGCETAFDEWVDEDLVKRPNTISTNAPEITFLFGRWSLTAVNIGNNFAMWGKVPGVEINSNGTYTWYQGTGRPPVKGRWVADAKVLKLNEGTPQYDGVILKDEEGKEWKAFKWVKVNDKPGIELDQMCSGHSVIGSRVK